MHVELTYLAIVTIRVVHFDARNLNRVQAFHHRFLTYGQDLLGTELHVVQVTHLTDIEWEEYPLQTADLFIQRLVDSPFFPSGGQALEGETFICESVPEDERREVGFIGVNKEGEETKASLLDVFAIAHAQWQHGINLAPRPELLQEVLRHELLGFKPTIPAHVGLLVLNNIVGEGDDERPRLHFSHG